MFGCSQYSETFCLGARDVPLGGALGKSAPSTSFILKTPPSYGVPTAKHQRSLNLILNRDSNIFSSYKGALADSSSTAQKPLGELSSPGPSYSACTSLSFSSLKVTCHKGASEILQSRGTLPAQTSSMPEQSDGRGHCHLNALFWLELKLSELLG